MARKLKIYTTSAGFFDLAIAAPSMKAALEAWGSTTTCSIKALPRNRTIRVRSPPRWPGRCRAAARPRLERPVQRRRQAADGPARRQGPGKARQSGREETEPAPRPPDDRALRKAALAFEQERKRREPDLRSEEQARRREAGRRDRAIAAAQAALEDAEAEHRKTVDRIDKDRATLDRRAQAEDVRWKKTRERLDEALRQSRTGARSRD